MSTAAADLVARHLAADASKLLFTEARTCQFFHPQEVPLEKLKELYELAKWGPTSANMCPMRVQFVRSAEAKAKLVPCMMDTNQEKVLGAPVVAIIAYDTKFYEQLPKLMPPFAFFADVLRANEAMAADMGNSNTNMQAAYFILAARSVGLDAGPMGGFDKTKVDEAFFTGEGKPAWKSVVVINLGYGDQSKVYPRAPRLTFDEAVLIE